MKTLLSTGVALIYFWLALFLVLAGIEAATLGLFTIWFAIGALFGFFAALAGLPLLWQVILFIIVTIVLLIFTRPVAAKYFNTRIKRTNVDRFIGEKGVVIEAIDAVNGQGQVRVLGQVWSARALNGERIAVDTQIEVQEIAGVKLIVKKVAE